MALPVEWPIRPMLAKRARRIPTGSGWVYEPKWDGFRTLVFRDGDEWELQSRDCKPLARYFPELEDPAKRSLPERCVADGEIVIASAGALDFDALLLRIHPAASRVARLAEETPASLVLWDLLCEGDQDLRQQPFAERRARLERALETARPPVHLTPLTADRSLATDWFERFEGAGLDGVVAKRAEGVYEEGKRVMVKVKHRRTADCVLAGFRWHKRGPGTLLGSMILGLYDGEGRLHHVGVAASFTDARRRELVAELAPLREGALDDHPWAEWMGKPEGAAQRVPGMTSRWNPGKALDWVPLRCERVVEVRYDHMQGTRFRHTAHFVRWRPDKPPAECTYDQLDVTPPLELARIFGAGRQPG